MTRDEIVAELKSVVVNALDLEGVSPEDIEADAPLFGEGLGLDSIDALELGMAVKKRFDVVFSQDPAENKAVFRSVSTIADFIAAQKGEVG